MRTSFEIIRAGFLTLIVLVSAAGAQDQPGGEPKDGFIRLANAVDKGTGPLTVEVDGKIINAKGYKPGAITGGVSLPPGIHAVRISREGVVAGTTRVNVATNETTTLIPYAEKVPAADDQPVRWEIRMLRLKQRK